MDRSIPSSTTIRPLPSRALGLDAIATQVEREDATTAQWPSARKNEVHQNARLSMSLRPVAGIMSPHYRGGARVSSHPSEPIPAAMTIETLHSREYGHHRASVCGTVCGGTRSLLVSFRRAARPSTDSRFRSTWNTSALASRT